VIEDVLTDQRFQNELRSTGRRLDPMFGFPLSLMLARTGVDFMRAVADQWPIIAVLRWPGSRRLDRKLFATLLINQIIAAMERLIREDFKEQEEHKKKYACGKKA
jgi:hypothetical protein